jgi:hypothetical protein
MLISEGILALQRLREELGGDAPLATEDGLPVLGFTAGAPVVTEDGQPVRGWDEESRWCLNEPLTRR